MRQITIKELGKRLSIEMANLPFAVTRYGRVIGVMTEEGTDLSAESTDLITKGTDNISKADKPKKITRTHTDAGHWTNPLKNTVLAPKY